MTKSQHETGNKTKNAIIMLLLMNTDSFDPLIINEPKNHLDTTAVTNLLTHPQTQTVAADHLRNQRRTHPALRRRRPGHRLHFRQKLLPECGDICTAEIKQHILEIFEGNPLAFDEKTRMLRRVME